MSSNYHVLCMAHDPAIVIDGGWTSRADAIDAVEYRTGDLRAHANCDLLIGRYSYPLVEVCCPPGTTLIGHPSVVHREPEWIDAALLRLLHAAYRSKDAAVLAAAQGVRSCWTAQRMGRLRIELGIDEVTR